MALHQRIGGFASGTIAGALTRRYPEEERGLEAVEDHLRAAVLRATLPPGGQGDARALDGDRARARR